MTLMSKYHSHQVYCGHPSRLIQLRKQFLLQLRQVLLLIESVASIVPPVASKSSVIRTRCPGLIASL